MRSAVRLLGRFVFVSLAASPLAAMPSAHLRSASSHLSFEARVEAQHAIERVYYAHQIGASRRFDDAVPRAMLESKVRAYLQESLALESVWKTPVTGAMLLKETERITRNTRMPDRLREIEAALGDDPLLIQECLARPVLVERLARGFFAQDRALRGRTWEEWWGRTRAGLDAAAVETVASRDAVLPIPADGRAWIPNAAASPADMGTSDVPGDTWDNGSLDDVPDARYAHTAVWTGSLMIVWGGEAGVNSETGGRYDPLTDSWEPISRTNVPQGRQYHTAVWTGSEMIIWGGSRTIGGGASRLKTGGRYNPASDTWIPTSLIGAPSGRLGHTEVWTGIEMVVWGGPEPSDTGGRYNPATDTWAPVSTLNAPSLRSTHSAVWTGSRMIVWGGYDGTYPITGGRYNPATDTWLPTSIVNAPSARTKHTAVWTGTQMVVWGGRPPSYYAYLDTGGRYDPVSDTWTPTSMVDAPSARSEHTAVWSGSRMLVWGGDGPPPSNPSGTPISFDSGARYDPLTDTWDPISAVNAPEARSDATAVWTGGLMIVWGGTGDGTGGRYDPATDTWSPTHTTSAPEARTRHTAVWTGTHMVVWGGFGAGGVVNTGGRYDPALDHWSPTSTVDAPVARVSHTAVWTGSRMIVWGGSTFYPIAYFNSGGRYDPVSDTWTATSLTSAPSPRSYHAAAWTGDRMVVWGGYDATSYAVGGGRYDPVTDLWTPVSMTNSPVAGPYPRAVWSGDVMIVWSADYGTGVGNGGRYDPVADTWAPVTTIGAPHGLTQPVLVWTGSAMVAWGSSGSAIGGRYDPVSDTWRSMTTVNAPDDRYDPSVVWTGSEMVVWGGHTTNNCECADPEYFDTGGRYDPAGDTWTAMATLASPSRRSQATAVWTGRGMIVWGGDNYEGFDSGGQYVPYDMTDDDGDGVTVHGGDCNDANPLVWRAPSIVPAIVMTSGSPADPAWASQAAQSGPETVYDLVSGEVGPLLGINLAGGACLYSGSTAAYADSRAGPALGKVYWYLVRARNSCGTGSYGSAQRDAAIPSCP